MLPFQLTFAGAITTLAPVTEADGRLGLCDVLPGNPPGASGTSWAQLAYNAGARINRWEFRWDRVERVRNEWDFSADDAAVQASQQAGLGLLGILIATPAWATASGQLPGNGVPRGLARPYTDPKNLWAAYVRQTVTHYKGKIRYWEVWNEPDLSYFWTGGPDSYFRLLKVAYLTVKSVDPSAQVLVGGMVVPDLAFLGQVLDDAANDPAVNQHGGYLDAVAWHAYGQARTILSNIARVKATLSARGYGAAPIWVTEDGFPSSNPNGEPRQAAYVLQTITYALEAGASKVLVYRASDDQDAKHWGVVSAAGLPRMGYVAFQLAAHYLSHLSAMTYAPDATAERFTLYRPNQRITLLWNRNLGDRTERFTAAAAGATLLDSQGAATPLAPRDGQYRLSLPGATYNAGIDPQSTVVGGPPQLVIEDNTAPNGFDSQGYLPPLTGTQRRLTVFNEGQNPAVVQVEAAAHPQLREVVQLAPHAMKALDLDLMSGPAYHGFYRMRYSGTLSASAVSSQGVANSAAPAAGWFVPAAPRSVSLTNASAKTVQATITTFDENGSVRNSARLLLRPQVRQDWSLPAHLQSKRLALAVQASGPIMVADIASAAAGPVSQAQTTWYAVLPPSHRLSVFNPNASGSSQVDIHFVGGPVVSEMQIHLGPHHLFSLPTHGAQAVVLAATNPVIAGYEGNGNPASPLATSPSTMTGFTAASPLTRVAVLNPSPQPAHVALSVFNGATGTERTAVVPPMALYTLQLSNAGSLPHGVLVRSDVPVVAGPTT